MMNNGYKLIVSGDAHGCDGEYIIDAVTDGPHVLIDEYDQYCISESNRNQPMLREENLDDIIESLYELSEERRRLDKQIAELKDLIKARMGGDERIKTSDARYEITYKHLKKKVLDKKLLEHKYPEIVEECTKEQDYRQMLLK